ncbi:protein JTB isoform 2-T2 [Guaruba guarouba]
MAPARPRLCAVLGLLLCGLRPAAAMAADERRSESPAAATACWRVEDFVVAQECGPCSGFQMKTVPECSPTGFVERINCAGSGRAEFKSCRSARVEARGFWRFVGAALAVAAVAAALVLARQRVLDRRALEKVRKQMEAI